MQQKCVVFSNGTVFCMFSGAEHSDKNDGLQTYTSFVYWCIYFP